MNTSGICNVLAESEFAIDVKGTLWTWNGEIGGVLVHKAFGLLFEGRARLVIPPARVSARFVVLRSRIVKSC